MHWKFLHVNQDLNTILTYIGQHVVIKERGWKWTELKVKHVEQQGVVSCISSGLGGEQHDRWSDELESPPQGHTQATADKKEQLFNSLIHTETPEKAGGEDGRGSQILD